MASRISAIWSVEPQYSTLNAQHLEPFKQRYCLTGRERDYRFFPVRRLAFLAHSESAVGHFPADGHRVNLRDRHFIHFLDRLGDLDFVGVVRHPEGVLAAMAQVHALLGEQRALDDLIRVSHSAGASSVTTATGGSSTSAVGSRTTGSS